MAMEKFHYQTRSGKKLTVPHMKDALKFGIIRKMRKIESEEEQSFFLIESIMTEAQLAIIDDMSPDEVGEFLNKWQEDSPVDASKSDGDSSDD